MNGKLLGGVFAFICLAFIWMACLAAQAANAQTGYAHGIGPHLNSPTTISVGRFYYRPGGGGSSDWQTMDDGLRTALRATEKVRHAPESARKARCRALHAEYVSRHGLTTPQPLKGYSGCTKWAKDSSYWKARRESIQSLPAIPSIKSLSQGFISALL